MRRDVEIGLLYSRTGDYAAIAAACRRGALNAVAAINADHRKGIRLRVTEQDPAGNLDHYEPLCADMLRDGRVRHVVGCVTSSSRKEVIPALEKAGGTLWYACPYEGFECSDRVIYTHACANQHLLPLLHWAFSRYGRRGHLVGSNYIWGWEMNRVAREVIGSAGGTVTGERHQALGDTDVARLIDELRAAKPDFVLNNLIGQSSRAFLEAMRVLRAEDPFFAEGTCPVLSCNLTECELPGFGAAAEGVIAAGPHFAGAPLWGAGHGAAAASSFEAAAYVAVATLAAIEEGPGDPAARLAGCGVDPETRHMELPVLIARVEGGRFRVLEHSGPVVADPYLTRRERWPTARYPALRVVT
ncbi:transporter substrate-binding protein [Limimaricola cinnabarinus]|uniref:transporter substrate-binding protein n=1 Tax=Limimaricola cinnabarinus TaxID=1125964 RepID=UPI002FE3C3E1